MPGNVRLCIYCEQCKPESDFSLEHIFPDSLGGSLCDETFKTRNVCRDCNSTSGLWVDGPFIRQWFSKNYSAQDAFAYLNLDPNIETTLPLSFMGKLDLSSIGENKVCDVWLGPCGDRVYHIRKRHSDRFDTFVGGNPVESKKDPGQAFLLLATDKQFWIRIVISSFLKHFKKAKKYAVNIEINQDGLPKPVFHAVGPEEEPILNEIWSMARETHKLGFSIQLGVEHRFLAKVALGIGYNIFGERFLDTAYAKILRNSLWEKDLDKRFELGFRCTGLFQSNTDLLDLIAWKGGHTILLLGTGQYLMLVLCLYGKVLLQVPISNEYEFWSKDKRFQFGEVNIVVPQTSDFVGSIPFPKYLAHNQGIVLIESLVNLEQKRIDINKLPPFRD